MTVKVLNPGLLTSVQDLGRPGYFHLGIPVSGAMDNYAMRAANLLVGNSEDAAGLEAVFVGPTLEFAADSLIAVTGGDMPMKVDGEAAEGWTAVPVRAGQVVTFDYLRSGARICVAIAGGIDVPVALGSRSTYPIGALGGFQGRALAGGDELPIGPVSPTVRAGRRVGPELRRTVDGPAELRVLPGLYDHRVVPESLDAFFADDWKVAPEADRMGYRLRGGKPLEFVEREPPFGAGSDPSNIVDSCYPYGSVQVPGGTEPIILHRDAVSGGGYFMVGTVISADMDIIGQLQPNTPVRFKRVDMGQALAARRDRAEMIGRLRAALAT
jgi:biotin-dependent carboxylase-like uncharacterized protein